MKKLLAMILALCMIFALCACGQQAAPAPAPAAAPAAPAEAAPAEAAPAEEAPVELTLWTYPIGKWGDSAAVEEMMAQFYAATGIVVNVDFLAYADGDDKVNTAIEANAAPDLIMEGPERLVANWGEKGFMVDIADMWDDTDKAQVNPACAAACFNASGACYEYPVCMTAHCMAVNLEKFKAAGADKYLDLDKHTWTTENFIKAVEALAANNDTVGAVYCAGQGGDQGTRALVNNLYGGTFTDAAHTKYTANTPENIKALELLQGMKGINFDASIVGGDEQALFRQGVLDMAFCWNIGAQENTDAGNEVGKTNDGDEIVFMAFPAEGDAKLCGGIWGFGIFDNGDDAKIAAAKEFIKYFADGEGTPTAVKASTYFAVRDTAGDGVDLTGVWADSATKAEYAKLMPLLGDYYQVAPKWAEARTAWWNMLQRIGTGGVVADEVAAFEAEVNG